MRKITLLILPLLLISFSNNAQVNNNLDKYNFLYAGESTKRDIYIVKQGKVTWEYHDDKGKGEISDAVLLSNGNILIAHQHAIKLINKKKQVIWELKASENTEIHTAMPIGKKHVIYIQNGDPAWVKVVNIKTNETVKSFTIPTKDPKNTHGHFRHARLTQQGTLLVAHLDHNKVAEYDANGKEIWSYETKHPWGVTPLDNGNILITNAGNWGGVTEVTKDKKIVFEFKPTDALPYSITSLQNAWKLPNGNYLINNWFSSWGDKFDSNNTPIQAIEITPNKKVVWVLNQWNNPNLGPSTTIQLLNKKHKAEHQFFGDIK